MAVPSACILMISGHTIAPNVRVFLWPGHTSVPNRSISSYLAHSKSQIKRIPMIWAQHSMTWTYHRSRCWYFLWFGHMLTQRFMRFRPILFNQVCLASASVHNHYVLLSITMSRSAFEGFLYTMCQEQRLLTWQMCKEAVYMLTAANTALDAPKADAMPIAYKNVWQHVRAQDMWKLIHLKCCLLSLLKFWRSFIHTKNIPQFT